MPRKPLGGVERHTCPRGKRPPVSLCHTASAGVGAEGAAPPYPRLVFGVAARPPFFSKKGEEGWGTGAATGRGNAPGKEGRDPTRSTPKRAESPPQEHTSLRSKGECVTLLFQKPGGAAADG